MEHFVEVIMELLFSLHKDTPDKMPEDISYNANFVVKYPSLKNLIGIIVILVFMVGSVLGYIFVPGDTKFLFVIFIVLSCIVFFLTLFLSSIRCTVTEEYLQKSYLGSFSKHVEWRNVPCLKVVERTDNKEVIIAVYNENGKCVIDLNSEMDNAWHVVKMAEAKNIEVKYEKDLSLKQISRL